MLNENPTLINSIAVLKKKKKNSIKMSQYFSKPHQPFDNVKVDLSNQAKILDLKNETGVNRTKLAAKSDLASLSLKAKVDK